MYTMFRIYSDGTYTTLRKGYTDLAELKGFVPVYENQGMAVAIDDADGKEVYATPTA